MVLADALKGFGITWIYWKGREPGKPFLGQGPRFGLALAVLMTIPTYLIHYAVQPRPGGVVCKQIVCDVAGVPVMGIVVAALNQEPKRDWVPPAVGAPKKKPRLHEAAGAG